jgi:hypothetical protein
LEETAMSQPIKVNCEYVNKGEGDVEIEVNVSNDTYESVLVVGSTIALYAGEGYNEKKLKDLVSCVTQVAKDNNLTRVRIYRPKVLTN